MARPPPVAAPSMSMWQQGAVGLRCIIDANWALRRTGAVAFMTGVGGERHVFPVSPT